MVTSQQQEAAEVQIRELQRVVDYQIREYPIEVVVEKFVTGTEDGKNEIFVPNYQRDLVWAEERQSKFIESLLIGLPIPYVFVADVGSEDEELAGRLEIVDGTQRIRTLARFIGNELMLQGLEKLTTLNGFCFRDLPFSRQRRFNRITLRLIELTEQATEETRRDMFERINSGSMILNPMENRRGAKAGQFIDLVQRLSKDPKFVALAPMTEANAKRFGREELVCRFFAFYDQLELYGDKEIGNRVSDFVDRYVEQMNSILADPTKLTAEVARLETTWDQTMSFISTRFPFGFTKSKTARTTPNVRFDAIAVGTALALKDDPTIATRTDISLDWLHDPNFKKLTTSDAANNKARVHSRIGYVRDMLKK